MTTPPPTTSLPPEPATDRERAKPLTVAEVLKRLQSTCVLQIMQGDYLMEWNCTRDKWSIWHGGRRIFAVGDEFAACAEFLRLTEATNNQPNPSRPRAKETR